jgi:UDP-glucose 4-epimerase
LSHPTEHKPPDSVSVVEEEVRDRSVLVEVVTGVDLVLQEAVIVNVDESVVNPVDSQAVNVGER